MKNIDELNGLKVKAKIRGEYVDCVLSIASSIQFKSGSLLFCQDKVNIGMPPDDRAKYYGKTGTCAMSEIDEFVNEELGIFIYNNAPARKSAIEKANYIYLNNSKINFYKLQKICGYFYCSNTDEMNFPELTEIGEATGACDINTLSFPKLENIHFFGCENVSLDMPKLKTLSCEFLHNTHICAPNLIKADILTLNNKDLSFPKLEEVSVCLEAKEAQTVYLPVLKKYNNCHDIQFQKARKIYMPLLQTKCNVRIFAFDAQELNVGPQAECQIFTYTPNKDKRVISSTFKWDLDGCLLSQLISKRKDYKILRSYETGKMFYAVPDGKSWIYCKDSYALRWALKRKGERPE